MKVNINILTEVKLTDYGLNYLKEKLGDRLFKHLYSKKIKKDNKFRIELWDLMSIFGERMYMGCEQLFVKNELNFISDDLDKPKLTRKELDKIM